MAAIMTMMTLATMGARRSGRRVLTLIL